MILADALIFDDPIALQITVAPLTERETFTRVRLVLSPLTVILPIPDNVTPVPTVVVTPLVVIRHPMRVTISLPSNATHRKTAVPPLLITTF